MANEQNRSGGFTYTVYIHRNKTNGKVYVGRCLSVKRRWESNGRGYKRGNNTRFKEALQKYGWDGFEHIVCKEGLSKEEADSLEKELIAKNNALGDGGYNMTNGGDGVSGLKMSLESKTRMSIAAKKRPKESWAKSLEYRKNRSNYNKRLGITVASRPKLKVVDANGNIYESILDASKQLGVNYFTLWNQIKGRRENKLGVVLYE